MDCSMPDFPVHHQLLEFIQTHVHCIGDAIQPSHPLLSLSLPTFNLSQHQGLFKWVSSSHQVAKGLEFELQLTLKTLSLFKEYSGLISFRIDWLDLLAAQGTFKSSPIPHFKSISSSNEYSGLISFTVCIITNCGKFLKRWEYQTTLPVSWKSCMQVRKQQLELDMEHLERSISRLYIVTLFI